MIDLWLFLFFTMSICTIVFFASVRWLLSNNPDIDVQPIISLMSMFVTAIIFAVFISMTIGHDSSIGRVVSSDILETNSVYEVLYSAENTKECDTLVKCLDGKKLLVRLDRKYEPGIYQFIDDGGVKMMFPFPSMPEVRVSK